VTSSRLTTACQVSRGFTSPLSATVKARMGGTGNTHKVDQPRLGRVILLERPEPVLALPVFEQRTEAGI
jgi:hypothetical protein